MPDQAELMGRYREALSHFEKDALIEMQVVLTEMALSHARTFAKYHGLVGKVHRQLRSKKFRDAAELAASLSAAPVPDPARFVADMEATVADVQRERRESIQLVEAGPRQAGQPSTE